LEQKPIEDQRDHLVRLIAVKQPQGSLKNNVTIVFDGRPGRYAPPASSTVKIVFSQDRSADELIKAAVNAAASKKTYVVVTDDKDIRLTVRAQGAQVVSVGAFLDKLSTLQEPQGQQGPYEAGKPISHTLEHAINKELIEVWLKKKDKIDKG